MTRTNPLTRASKLAVFAAVMVLAFTMLLMAACSSGQASSSTSGGSAGASEPASLSAARPSAASATSESASSESAASESSKAPSAQSEQADNASAFVGTWDLVDMEQEGTRISEANPDAVPQMREENYLNITEDGFYDLVQQGEVVQGIWQASSPTKGSMMYGTDEISLEIEDGKLVVGSEKQIVMYFEKGEDRETPPLPEGQTNLREVLG